MKTRAGISKRFVIVIASIVSALVLILAVAFNQVLRSNHSMLTGRSLPGTSAFCWQDANHGQGARSPQAGEGRRACPGHTLPVRRRGRLSHVIIFTRTADENYFRAAEIVNKPGDRNGHNQDDVVRENREAGYLKKGLFEPAVDPLVRASAACTGRTYTCPTPGQEGGGAAVFILVGGPAGRPRRVFGGDGQDVKDRRAARDRAGACGLRRELSFHAQFTLLIDGFPHPSKRPPPASSTLTSTPVPMPNSWSSRPRSTAWSADAGAEGARKILRGKGKNPLQTGEQRHPR